jgi:fumarate reductase subunit C
MATRVKSKVKTYNRPVPADWWLKRPAYTKFIVRELSSAFCAGYAIFLAVMMARAKDEAAFHEFVEGLKSPASIVLHLLVLGFAVYHAVTFFNLTPKVIVLRRGEDKVADSAISGAHFGLWAVATLVLLGLALLVK